MKKVICVGSALQDVFLPTGDGIVAETPQDLTSKRKITFELGAKYRIENRFTAAGGGALNTAIGLARLGVTAMPYSLIGGDANGMWLRDVLAKNGVETTMLRQVSEAQTDLSTIIVDRKTGERVIFVNRDLQETLTIDASAMGMDAIIFVSALSGRWRENYEVIQSAVKKCGCELAYNPGQSNLDEDMDTVIEMLNHATYLFVNKDEAIQIVMHMEHEEGRLDDEIYLLEKLQKYPMRTIVMTAGLRGAWMVYKGKQYFVPSSGQRPVDTTGAGDSFTSGVLAALIHGETPEMACAWGVANATRVVQFYGSNEGLLSLQTMRKQADVTIQKVERL